MVQASVAIKIGEAVTTYSTHGGVGVGVVIDGVVLKSGGNGWYYPCENLARYERDGGKGYLMAIRRVAGR